MPPVYHCDHKVTITKFRTVKTYDTKPGFPVWRGHCGRCGAWLCREGHEVHGKQVHWMDGPDGRLAVCEQGGCGKFYQAWFKVWRAVVQHQSSRWTHLNAEEEEALLQLAKEHRGTPEGRAYKEFLDYFTGSSA